MKIVILIGLLTTSLSSYAGIALHPTYAEQGGLFIVSYTDSQARWSSGDASVFSKWKSEGNASREALNFCRFNTNKVCILKNVESTTTCNVTECTTNSIAIAGPE